MQSKGAEDVREDVSTRDDERDTDNSLATEPVARVYDPASREHVADVFAEHMAIELRENSVWDVQILEEGGL